MAPSQAFATPTTLPLNTVVDAFNRTAVRAAPTRVAPSAILRRRVAKVPNAPPAPSTSPVTPVAPADAGSSAPVAAAVTAASTSEGAFGSKGTVKTASKSASKSAIKAAAANPSAKATRPKPAKVDAPKAANAPKADTPAAKVVAPASKPVPVKASTTSTAPSARAAPAKTGTPSAASPANGVAPASKAASLETGTASDAPQAKTAAAASKTVPVKAGSSPVAPPAKAVAPASKASPAKEPVSAQVHLACGSGVSNHKNTSKAAKEAFASALAALPEGRVPDLAIVSATSDRGGGVIVNAFKLALGKVPFIGSTTCGFVLTPDGPVERGMSVMLLSSSGSFATASAEFGSGDVGEAVTTAAEDLKEKVKGKQVKAIYMTASPGSEETIMKSIHGVFGNQVPIVGGSAADEDVSGMWRIFAEGRRFPAGVAMLAIAGDAVKAGACINSPYTPSKKSMKVTGAEGRKLLTLNDKPAADAIHTAVGYPIYFEHKNGGVILGPMSKRPYALKRNNEYLSVHIASIEQPSGAVNLFAEAAVGDELVQMENVGGGNSAKAAGIAIEESFKGAKEAGGIETPKAAFLVYCGGLGIAVGDDLEGNLTGNFAGLPLPAAALGVSAFGEQGPSKGGASQHWNLAVGMLLLE